MATSLGPNDIPQLYECLTRALSADESIRKPAEATLSSLSTCPGFCSCLMEIIGNYAGEQQARWLSSVLLKNNIDRCWRSRRDTSHIPPEEKVHLRGKVLTLMREESPQIAAQLAVVIAKITRIDFPKEWPDVFTVLVSALQPGGEPLVTQRCYLVLHHALKELSTKRLAVDQKNYSVIAAQLLQPIQAQWAQDTNTLLQRLSAFVPGQPEEGESLALVLERWRFCLKAMRRLLVHGFLSDAKSLQQVPKVQEMLPLILQTMESLLALWARVTAGGGLPQEGLLQKGILKLMKTIIDLQTAHPWSCSEPALLLPLLQFAANQICTPPPAGTPLFEPFLIQCMVFLKKILEWKKLIGHASEINGSSVVQYGTPPQYAEGMLDRVGSGAQREMVLAALEAAGMATLGSFLTAPVVERLLHALVHHYFPLREPDLQEWLTDPEGYHHNQDTLSWRDSLRPCAEELFLTTLRHFPEALCPTVLRWLQEATASPCMLQREAVYNAVGLGSYELHDQLDFATWFQHQLVPELRDRSPDRRPLRRRVAWVVGAWVTKITPEVRPAMYELLIGLLEEDDKVVQLSAVGALHALVYDFGFDSEQFLPYVQGGLQQLFRAIHTAQEFDSQVQIFNLISALIEQLGVRIAPSAASILSVVPVLWGVGMQAGQGFQVDPNDGRSMIRMQVVQAMGHLVTALEDESPQLYGVLLPLLRYCTDPGAGEALTLLEDGLALLHDALKAAPFPHPDLLSLFPNIVHVVSNHLDHLQVCVNIVTSYVLLGGAEFLSAYGPLLGQMLEGLLGNVVERGTMLLFALVDTILQALPDHAPALLQGVLVKLLRMLLASEESDMVVASGAGVLSRVLLQTPAVFTQLMAVAAQGGGLGSATPGAGAGIGGAEDGESVLMKYVDVWLDKADSLCSTKSRKLMGLALCALLTIGSPQVLLRLDQILSVCVSVVFETEGDADDPSLGSDYWVSQSLEGYDEEGCSGSEGARKKALHDLDPVTKLSVKSSLTSQLQLCSTLHNPQAWQAAFQSVDPSIIMQLKQCTGEAPRPSAETSGPDGR